MKSLLGWLLGLVAILSWHGIMAEPLRYAKPFLVISFLVVVTGWLIRRLAPDTAVVRLSACIAQLVVIVVAVSHHWAGSTTTWGLPGDRTLTSLARSVELGAQVISVAPAPVEDAPRSTALLITLLGLLGTWLIDVLINTLQRPVLTLGVLLGLMGFPIAVLTQPMNIVLIVIGLLTYLGLLAVQGREQIVSWSRNATFEDEIATNQSRAGLSGTARWVAFLAVVVGLVGAQLMPLGSGIAKDTGTGNDRIVVNNPMLDLGRNLNNSRDIQLLRVKTKDPSPRYVRMTVLDEFTGDAWVPSSRDLPSNQQADGPISTTPDVAPLPPGKKSYHWDLEFLDLVTKWLPLPSGVTHVDAGDDWRYDKRTLDYVDTASSSHQHRDYAATNAPPEVTAEQLRGATGQIPASILLGNRPTNFRPTPAWLMRFTMRETSGNTPYERAVSIQEFLRSRGDFTYSLSRAPGSGEEALREFLTESRTGYCEQFASAMAVMAHAVDIPSRVVVGFLAGVADTDGWITFTSDDLHAWPELYFAGVGWVRFEPTPSARTGSAPAYTNATQPQQPSTSASAGPDRTQPTRRPAPRPQPKLRDPGAGVGSEQGGTPWPWLLPGSMVVLFLLAAPGLVRLRQRRRRLDDATDPVMGAWAELQATATDLGHDWDPRRSPRQQAQALVSGVDQPAPEEVAGLGNLLVRVEQSRYAKDAVVVADREATARTVALWRHRLASGRSRMQRLQAAVLPRSLWRWKAQRRR